MVELDIERGKCRIEGKEYPMVGLGTYRLTGEICAKALIEAANIGYRIIDTATYYNNFEGMAQGLKKLDRSQLYIISKVWHDMQAKENLRKDLQETQQLLQTDYLDAYLLHWPNSQIPIKETLTAMRGLVQEKKVRHIGLSNVTVNHLKKALEVGVSITWIQVEMHPYFYDKELLAFCKECKIGIQAWRPLNLGRMNEDEVLIEMGKKHGKTACQIALRWIVQHGCIPLPGSKDARHMQENLNVMDFVLSTEEMHTLDQRAVTGSRYRLDKARVGFTDEFDFSYEECWP